MTMVEILERYPLPVNITIPYWKKNGIWLEVLRHYDTLLHDMDGSVTSHPNYKQNWEWTDWELWVTQPSEGYTGA